jgi:hypothetical protein
VRAAPSGAPSRRSCQWPVSRRLTPGRACVRNALVALRRLASSSRTGRSTRRAESRVPPGARATFARARRVAASRSVNQTSLEDALAERDCGQSREVRAYGEKQSRRCEYRPKAAEPDLSHTRKVAGSNRGPATRCRGFESLPRYRLFREIWTGAEFLALFDPYGARWPAMFSAQGRDGCTHVIHSHHEEDDRSDSKDDCNNFAGFGCHGPFSGLGAVGNPRMLPVLLH